MGAVAPQYPIAGHLSLGVAGQSLDFKREMPEHAHLGRTAARQGP